MLGRVKWFNEQKGFGFITTQEGKDIFVHFSEIRMDGYRTLLEGQDVVFDVARGDKGDIAIDVEVIYE